jgi:hypothetical protein
MVRKPVDRIGIALVRISKIERRNLLCAVLCRRPQEFRAVD